eukprot:SAG11_NODE_549_length_8592_cov_11.089721_7_plen_149_part_00
MCPQYTHNIQEGKVMCPQYTHNIQVCDTRKSNVPAVHIKTVLDNFVDWPLMRRTKLQTMYARKDDAEAREHMVKLGYLNPLQGQHKSKAGWEPKYVRSDGNNAPSIYFSYGLKYLFIFYNNYINGATARKPTKTSTIGYAVRSGTSNR